MDFMTNGLEFADNLFWLTVGPVVLPREVFFVRKEGGREDRISLGVKDVVVTSAYSVITDQGPRLEGVCFIDGQRHKWDVGNVPYLNEFDPQKGIPPTAPHGHKEENVCVFLNDD
jgi:hypothetical protein